MKNPRISAVWITIKQFAPFSCTPRLQEVHTKAEIVHFTPGLLGLEELFNCDVWEMYCKIGLILEFLQFGVRTNRLNHSLVHLRVQEVHTKAEVVHLTPALLGLWVLSNCHA